MDDPDLIVLLAGGGKLANRIADAVSELVRQGAELGELEHREIVEGDQSRTVLAVPAIWVDPPPRCGSARRFRASDRQ